MRWSAFGNKSQVDNNAPKSAFEKTQKVYGKRMKDVPILNTVHPHSVTTNFDELLTIRKQNARKKANSNRRFMLFIGLALIIIIAIVLWETQRQLP